MDRMKEVTRAGVAVLFVSHNLRSVAEFCTRCLLLERGRLAMTGSSNDVISRYMSSNRVVSEQDDSKPVVVSKVCVRNRHG
jgi:lipopolysaccharide transport system ATP-binding protein